MHQFKHSMNTQEKKPKEKLITVASNSNIKIRTNRKTTKSTKKQQNHPPNNKKKKKRKKEKNWRTWK